MMQLRLTTIASGLALAISAGAAFAEPVPYLIDGVHSQAEFTIRHFFGKVPGRFNDLNGTILYDDKNLASSKVDVTIQTKSIFTNNERRDNHLRSRDFFFADSFPTITFKSTKVIPGEGSKFKVEGDLTMRGVTKLVVLDAELLGVGAVGIGGQAMGMRAGFEATTLVNRKDYNILWNKTLDQGGTLLGDEVNIHIAVEATKQDASMGKPPAAKGK